MSKPVDEKTFRARLIKACEYAKIPLSRTGRGPSSSALGKRLGVNKQTVDRWLRDGEPGCGMLYKLAESLKVDPKWLATGEGEMLPQEVVAELKPTEEDLIVRFRKASPSFKASMKMLALLATEDGIVAEMAKDTVSNAKVASAFGKAAKV